MTVRVFGLSCSSLSRFFFSLGRGEGDGCVFGCGLVRVVCLCG